MALYGDLYKTVKDSFSKGYNEAPLSMTTTLKSPSGITLKPTVDISQKHETKINLEFEGSWPVPVVEKPLAAKVGVKSSQMLTFEAKLKDLAPGLLLKASGDMDINKPDKDSYKASAEYKNQGLGVSADYSIKTGAADVSAAYSWNEWMFGGKGKFSGSSMKASEVGVSYTRKDDCAFAVTIEDPIGKQDVMKFGAIFHTNNSRKCVLASELALKQQDVALSLGSQWEMNGHQYKAKMDNQGKVGISMQHDLNSDIKATASASFSANDLQIGGFGLKLEWAQ
eukprot:NODE_1073_length_1025_cov_112.364143_g1028_i0.p1 GENE.NODE_1073_length_1025_cov_112.364143_g1028_i0~~NODE_1073_length_1025_cov_112.364143_g1028_i0.p1  ORF type:complete len:308 (+),score=106.74 NODE_1073_length_1025_cov_112.364143_g1028_i0:81-926(+)